MSSLSSSGSEFQTIGPATENETENIVNRRRMFLAYLPCAAVLAGI